MLEKLEGLPDDVMGVKATGTVTQDDYVNVLGPMLEKARQQGRRVRLVYQFGPGFQGFSVGGAWEDMRLGLDAMDRIDGLAIVTDVGWLRDSVQLMRMLMTSPVRVYANDEFDEAVAWLEWLPQIDAIRHRMREDTGVLVIEPRDPLRATDFDALARTVDPWIAQHGELQGLVIQMLTFPGWESIAGFVRHMQFFGAHVRKIRKVALVTDARGYGMLPRVADRFMSAEIRQYDYDELDEAIAWAGTDERMRAANAAA
jgi:hypothetical protein